MLALSSRIARSASRFSAPVALAARQAPVALAVRSRAMAMGPSASATTVPDDLLEKLGGLSTQALIDGLWVMGWPDAFIEGARPLAKGQKCVGRAVTLRFVPQRPDIAGDKPVGVNSPEYEAFELCGPKSVLVMASVGPWESVGGDIKFLRLKQLQLGGLVTDGSVRDTDEILNYGFPCFSYSTTPKQGPAAMQPWECNGVISCGKVVVRPGDAIIGDQDGVVCVPASHAQQVYDIAHGREVIEGVIKDELVKNPGPPGKYYPFKPPIKPESPLGKLLTEKGIKFYSTRAGPPRRRAGSSPFTNGGRRMMSTVPATMKAVVVKENGPAENLTYVTDFATPTIADGQVMVKNEFTGINFIDTYFRKGGPAYTQALPFVSGQEGAGVIVDVTPKAAEQGLAVGQRVAYSVLGTYCEYTAVPAAKIVNVPDGIGLDTATALMTQGLTAHYLTNHAHAGLVKPGEWMLIHGVGGGTCQWAAQMAKLKGYKVIGTCPEGKEDVGKATGVDELIVTKCLPGTPYEDYSSVDITAKVMEITGGSGVKAVIDGIGASTTDISIECLSRRGIFVTFGNASGPVPAFPPIRLIKKSAFLTRPKLLDYVSTREELMMRADEIFGWVQSGDLKVGIDKTFSLTDAVEGHKYLEAGKSKGKVLYKVE